MHSIFVFVFNFVFVPVLKGKLFMSCAQLPTGPTLHLAHLPFPHCRITQTTSLVDRTWGIFNFSFRYIARIANASLSNHIQCLELYFGRELSTAYEIPWLWFLNPWFLVFWQLFGWMSNKKISGKRCRCAAKKFVGSKLD